MARYLAFSVTVKTEIEVSSAAIARCLTTGNVLPDGVEVTDVVLDYDVEDNEDGS